MQEIVIGLVQINNSFSGQSYLPYSIGLLEAYARKNIAKADRYRYLMPIYSRQPVGSIIERLAEADIVGFSVYVWNARISLEVAKQLKRQKSGVLIIMGGPHVPDEAEDFLREHPYVDLVCHGEGERTFLSVLENYPTKSWDKVPSISYLKKDCTFTRTPGAERIKEVSMLPSPYLSGTFTELMKANPAEKWLVLWETNRGCPFRCTFCNWGSSTATKMSLFDMDRLFMEVDWFAENRIEFVFCCDSNFAMLPRDYNIVEYIVKIKNQYFHPKAFSVQNTKNSTERAYQVQKLLADAGLNKGVALSLQSINPTTLKNIKRENISIESFNELQRRFSKDGVETYSDLILGLPGETYSMFANGVSKIISSGQHNRIQFNNLSILPNSEMGQISYRDKFGMETVQSRIINIHGSLTELDNDIPEIQELVIGTSAMPKYDWVKTRTFGWVAGLLHFDKILQIPMIIAYEAGGISYRELIESFLNVSPGEYPILSSLAMFFEEKARDIQSGGVEYCQSKEWLNIYWPADEYALIDLCINNKLKNFYEEAERLLFDILTSKAIELPFGLLHEAVHLNRALMKLPFMKDDIEFRTMYNIYDFYQSVIVGGAIKLERQHSVLNIVRTKVVYHSWDEWCREVIWYGNKRGAYLYGNDTIERQIEGHY